MKIASRTIPPGILQPTPHANYKFPICPTFVDAKVPEGNGVFSGEPNFGEGTKYPVSRPWFTNAAIYCRPGALVLRKESFYTATKRATITDPSETRTFDFGPTVGPPRCQLQYELACPKLAVVSESQQHPPPPAGLIDYRIIQGYGFFPEIAVDSGYRGLDYPMWETGVVTWLHQICVVSAYFIEDVLVRGLISELPRFNDSVPPERYEKCGSCKVDFRDQTKDEVKGKDDNEDDGKSMKMEFPLYRDAWLEDGYPAHPSPARWYSNDALVSLAYVGWDRKPDDFTEVTDEMKKEMKPR